MHLNTIFKSMRPSFLVLTPVCVFLGVSSAILNQSPINLLMVSLILLGAMAAHISVNTLNEYYDFKSGLDLITQRTPFSGGSGALPDHPEMADSVRFIGLLSLLLAMIIGVYLMFEHGSQIMPIGIVGILLVISYTPWLNRSPFLCLIAPGLGFGVLMVIGTQVILTGEHNQLVWFISLVPFFLINNLLLLNQYPDIKADANLGRKTFPIVYGTSRSNLMYAVFILAAYLPITVLIMKGSLPTLSMIALIPMALSLFSLTGAIKHASYIGNFPQYMAANVAAAILTPLLLGLSFIMA